LAQQYDIQAIFIRLFALQKCSPSYHRRDSFPAGWNSLVLELRKLSQRVLGSGASLPVSLRVSANGGIICFWAMCQHSVPGNNVRSGSYCCETSTCFMKIPLRWKRSRLEPREMIATFRRNLLKTTRMLSRFLILSFAVLSPACVIDWCKNVRATSVRISRLIWRDKICHFKYAYNIRQRLFIYYIKQIRRWDLYSIKQQ